MKKLLSVLFVVILVFSFAVTAIAADMPTAKRSVSKGTKTATYPAGPIQKAERGFSNVLFGWTEIPKRVVDKTKEYRNPFKGLVLGSFQGTCRAFARTVSGVSEVATFPIGGYEKPAVLPDMPAAE
ncbi:MAG: exosortase system-associated protein, TIGR04073 family [Candidatus Omnitrophica bacterium]|nr:exosortase system-associated protein, TIGR04073 family [Candidatus Omnitrophota bacterium]